MGLKNIRSTIKSIKNDNRMSEQTRKEANQLEKYIGTDEKIPSSLKKSIFDNKSSSDSVEQMKHYIKNKK